MKKVEAIIRKTKFEEVKDELHKVGIDFLTFWDARGTCLTANQAGTWGAGSREFLWWREENKRGAGKHEIYPSTTIISKAVVHWRSRVKSLWRTSW